MDVGLQIFPNHFERELRLAGLLCNKNKSAIDIGANQGIYSHFMAKAAKNVVAFEPNIDLWENLQKVLSGNVELEASALSDICSSAVMKIDRRNTGISTIEEKNNFSCTDPASYFFRRDVQTRTLDSFEFSNVSLIKIDVEGHEEAVIRGARETIKLNQPVLIVESEDRHNAGAPHRLAKGLAEMGYEGFYLFESTLRKFSDLRAADTDTANLFDGSAPYINNFIFVPANQPALIGQIEEFARRK